jgi:uncharacterized protein YjiS (DUF1127 family)
MAYPTIITTNAAFSPFNVMKLVNVAIAAREVSKQRRALAKLSDQQLSDIGITPSQRTAECKRRFW